MTKFSIAFAVFFFAASLNPANAQVSGMAKTERFFKVVAMDKKYKLPINGVKIQFVSFKGSGKGITNDDGEATRIFKKGTTVAIAASHKHYYTATTKSYKLNKNKILKVMLKPNGKGPPPKRKTAIPTNTPGTQSTSEPTSTTAPTPLTCIPGQVPGDGNLDCCVNDADLQIQKSNFGKSPASITDGDYNQNGIVDSSDYSVWRDNVGRGCANIPTFTPNPFFTPTFTATATKTFTPVPPTWTPNPLFTATHTATVTRTPTITHTPSSTPTRTNTPQFTPSNTPTIPVDPPVITTHPLDRSVAPGGTAAFSVVASGQGLEYRWQKNGVDIVDIDENGTDLATFNQYSYNVASSAYGVGSGHFDYGSTFRVKVRNATGIEVYSRPATLTVTGTTRPGALSGQPQAFRVAINGHPRNNLSSTTTEANIYLGAPPTNKTATVRLKWNPNPSPYNAQYIIYQNSLEIARVPSNQFHFDAFISNTSLTTHDITKSFYVKGATAGNLISTNKSDTKSVKINFIAEAAPNPLPFADVTHPLSKSAPIGQYVQLCAELNATPEQLLSGPFLYQWYKDGIELSDNDDAWQACRYSNEPGVYEVNISSKLTSVISNPAEITYFSEPPEIVTPPVSVRVPVSTIYRFTVVVKGAGPFEYTWYQDGTELSGATNKLATLTKTSSSATNGDRFYVRITTPSGEVTSEEVRLDID